MTLYVKGKVLVFECCGQCPKFLDCESRFYIHNNCRLCTKKGGCPYRGKESCQGGKRISDKKEVVLPK